MADEGRTADAIAVYETNLGQYPQSISILMSRDEIYSLPLDRVGDFEFDEHVVNVHFEDQFEGGAMTFDYRMKPGVVTRSNALALMRAVGLDV